MTLTEPVRPPAEPPTRTALEGRSCARCDGPYYLTSYWGEPLCAPCCHLLAKFFDRTSWPSHPAERNIPGES